MRGLVNPVKSCILFQELSESEIVNLLQEIQLKKTSFQKDQIVALEGEECSRIGIVAKGTVEIQKIYLSGKTVTLARLRAGEVFGEVIIFSTTGIYPATILAAEETEIIFITKTDMVKLCSQNSQVLNNFMGLLSNKILALNKKLKNLSYQTIREKISGYLVDEYYQQKGSIIELPSSKKGIAEQLGIPRPSLSRELIHMKEEGLIDYDKRKIIIKKLNNLVEIIQG
jgi:CRP-like cAMP-binding protein